MTEKSAEVTEGSGGLVGVAAAQFAPVADKQANIEHIGELTAQARGRGARLVVFPEYSAFFTPRLGPRMLAAAEAVDGPFVAGLATLADRLDVTIVAGLAEKSPEAARFFSTVVAVAPRHGVVASYRKQHIYDAFGARESEWVRPGALGEPQTFSLGPFRVGLQACYDVRFPEVTRTLLDAGADVVAVPAEWVPGPSKQEHWRTLLSARAIENTVFVIGAGQTAPGGIGDSVILDPAGTALSELSTEPGLAVATLSPRLLSHVRETNPSLRLRRYAVVPGRPGEAGSVREGADGRSEGGLAQFIPKGEGRHRHRIDDAQQGDGSFMHKEGAGR
ncbi:MAG TPA: carbon-nitrogen hydrolase family protein [Microbacteriaceae bacterium]|nr:carbon-nitrogen hydrolase family protein [Microbacteriaceae bacterium]